MIRVYQIKGYFLLLWELLEFIFLAHMMRVNMKTLLVPLISNSKIMGCSSLIYLFDVVDIITLLHKLDQN